MWLRSMRLKEVLVVVVDLVFRKIKTQRWNGMEMLYLKFDGVLRVTGTIAQSTCVKLGRNTVEFISIRAHRT